MIHKDSKTWKVVVTGLSHDSDALFALAVWLSWLSGSKPSKHVHLDTLGTYHGRTCGMGFGHPWMTRRRQPKGIPAGRDPGGACGPGRDARRYVADAYLANLIRDAGARVASDPNVRVLAPHRAPPRALVEQACAEHVSQQFERVAFSHAQDGGDVRSDPAYAALHVGTGLRKSTAARHRLTEKPD